MKNLRKYIYNKITKLRYYNYIKKIGFNEK